MDTFDLEPQGQIGIVPQLLQQQSGPNWNFAELLQIKIQYNMFDENGTIRTNTLVSLGLQRGDIVIFDRFTDATKKVAIIENYNRQPFFLPSEWLEKLTYDADGDDNQRLLRKNEKVSKLSSVRKVDTGTSKPFSQKEAPPIFQAAQIADYNTKIRGSCKKNEILQVKNNEGTTSITPEQDFKKMRLVIPDSISSESPFYRDLQQRFFPIGSYVTIVSATIYPNIFVVKTMGFPTYYCAMPISDLQLPNDKKIGQFYQSFCSVFAVQNLPKIDIPRYIIECIDNNFAMFLQPRVLAEYFFGVLNLGALPNITQNETSFSYNQIYCFINFNAFDMATEIKTVYINIFKCSGEVAGAGMMLLFELLLKYYLEDFIKVELLAQPFLTQSQPGPELVEQCQMSLDKCYIDFGFGPKNPNSDTNALFNNEFIADIERILKTIIYRVMMMNCELFISHFKDRFPDLDCKCPKIGHHDKKRRGGSKKRKSKKRRKSKRRTKRRKTQKRRKSIRKKK